MGVRNLHPEGRFPSANVAYGCHGPAMLPAALHPGNAFEAPSVAVARIPSVISTIGAPELRRVIDGLPISAVVDKPYDLEALRQIVEAR